MNQSELEKRAKARREAALRSDTEVDLEERSKARRAYMQGGPGPNDPKELGFPGELKYPRMDVPVGGDSRQWEQNWFEGAAKVTKEKMGPSGVELELKKKMQRAKLSAQFIRQANQKDSYWEFFATSEDGKKNRLFRASVDDIFGREGQEVDADTWKWVSSNDYAKLAMKTMRSDGIDKVAYALTGVGFTREGTVRMIREQSLDKAKQTVLLGRRVARNLSLAEGSLKEALTQDYSDLQSVLADLRLVEKSVTTATTASDENRFALYRLADESFLDADSALSDVLANVKTAESKAQVKVAEMAAPEVAAAAPMAAPAVENPDRATKMSAPMPGGGMPYTEGGELYPPADERHAAPLLSELPASHGELPFQEWEQLELKDLSVGPSGKQRVFDKAEWAIEEMLEHDTVPTGDLAVHEEAAGGGLSHHDESGGAAPGLNMDEPEGRYGFESANEDYMKLPFGGLGGDEHAEAPAAEEPAKEEVKEEAPAEEEVKEDDNEKEEAAEKKDAEVEEEAEEKEASVVPSNDRRGRTDARTKLMQTALDEKDGEHLKEYFKKLNPPGSTFWTDYVAKATGDSESVGSREKGFADYAQDAGKTREEAAAPAPEMKDEAKEADEKVKASFEAKQSEALQKEALLKQKRAYDIALDMQQKGWIGGTKEDLHQQATTLLSLDDKAFSVFKAMCANMKKITQQSSVQIEEKIEKVAGHQRQVIKSGTSPAEDENLVKALGNLGWS